MRTCIGTLSVGVAVLLIATSPATAGTLYSQAPDYSLGGSYSDTGGQMIYDDFSVSTAGTATGLVWYGYYWVDLPGSATSVDFDIEILTDSGGLPGTSVSAQAVTAGFTTAGVSADSTTVYRFETSISSVALATGTTYWLLISEDDPATPRTGPTQWRWSRSAATGTHASWSTRQSLWLTATGDMAFTLTGSTTGAIIPLPAAAWLGLALLGMLWAGRRIRSLRTD